MVCYNWDILVLIFRFLDVVNIFLSRFGLILGLMRTSMQVELPGLSKPLSAPREIAYIWPFSCMRMNVFS